MNTTRPAIVLALAFALIVSHSSPMRAGENSSATSENRGETVEIARSYTLRSEILDQTRRINVYLPPSYSAEGQGVTRYPVLYLLDGGVQEDFFHIAGIASLAADFRKIREFIVIGIEGIDRYHDLTPPTTVLEDKERLPTHGGSAEFRSFLSKELKPFVEKSFRVSDETALIGESVAGLFVVETLLRQPDLFTAYIAVSPSLWWDNQSLARQSPALLKKSPPTKHRVYLTIGDEGGEMREALDLVSVALDPYRAQGLSLTYRPMEHETHGTIFHPAALAALREIFEIPEAVE